MIPCQTPPSAAFPPRGVTPNRGNNVAARDAENRPASGSGPGRRRRHRRTRLGGTDRIGAQNARAFRGANRQGATPPSPKASLSPAAIRGPRSASVSGCKKDGAARIRKHSNRPVFGKRLCQTNLLQALPAGASRVASTRRRVTHWVEGGSQPKGPGSSPVAASRFNHGSGQTSTKIWRSRCH